VQEISTLNKDIVAFVNGTDTPSVRAATEQKFPNWQRYLALHNVTVENRTISNLVRLADGGDTEADPAAPTAPEHDLFRVDFEQGPSVQRAAFFASFPNQQHSSVGADMGVKLYGGRLAADQAKGLSTNIPNVYAIGDANSDNVTNVPHALFSGKRAAVFLHGEFCHSLLTSPMLLCCDGRSRSMMGDGDVQFKLIHIQIVQLARQETAALIASDTTSVDERSLSLDPRAVWDEMNGGEEDMLDAGEFRM
jgi:hypothetical protein